MRNGARKTAPSRDQRKKKGDNKSMFSASGVVRGWGEVLSIKTRGDYIS